MSKYKPELDTISGHSYVMLDGKRMPCGTLVTLSLSIPAELKAEIRNYSKVNRMPMVQVMRKAFEEMVAREV